MVEAASPYDRAATVVGQLIRQAENNTGAVAIVAQAIQDAEATARAGCTRASEGLRRIQRERESQCEGHGFDAKNDDEHDDRELVWAAIYYLHGSLAETDGSCQRGLRDVLVRLHLTRSYAPEPERHGRELLAHSTQLWPFEREVEPPAAEQDDLRCLEKAGALIAAEIERRLRAREKTPTVPTQRDA